MASDKNKEIIYHRELSLSKEDLIKLICRSANIEDYENPIVIVRGADKISYDDEDLDFNRIKIRFEITKKEYYKELNKKWYDS